MRVTGKNQEQKPARNLRREARRYDDKDQNAVALGCHSCADRAVCGGLHRARDSYSCADDCCGRPETCDMVCLKRPEAFVDFVREINTFELGNVPRTAARPMPALPAYVPMIYHHGSREGRLEIEAVGVPLHQLYSRRDGRLLRPSRAAIAEEFGIADDAKILAVGSGEDKPIEAWWGLGPKRTEVIARLRDIGIDAVTSPNYSVFTDVPRYNDLANIKRIAIAWQEILDGGLPCGLHINARTERDYERLAMEFIEPRPEVTDVSFEFGTGAGRQRRQGFHTQELIGLAAAISRPLHLTMVGGILALPRLAPAFSTLTYIDTSAFMKAVYRQRLREGNDLEIVVSTELTEAGAPIDEMLASNANVMRRLVERTINVSRLNALHAGSERKLETPGKVTSATTAPISARAAGRK